MQGHGGLATLQALLLVYSHLAPSILWAQESNPVLEEVIVLGSLIPRADYTSISPVMTLDREDLEIDGRQTPAELLNRYPQFRPARNAGFSDQHVRAGATPLDLRGLGAKRTLVLLNGRRLGPGGAHGEVDINWLPVGLIDRVEVLTGGASSTYGADAVSGVVNFTLRDQIEGLELDASFAKTDRGDGDSLSGYMLGGTELSNGRGHVTGFASHFERESIARADRDISAVLIFEDFSTGELSQGGSFALPAGYSLWPPVIDGVYAEDGLTFDDQGDPLPFTRQDLYNFNDIADLFMEEQRTSLGGFIDYQLPMGMELGLALLLTNSESDITRAPTPTFIDNLAVNLDNPLLTNATREVIAANYASEGAAIASFPYAYRTVENGNRQRQFERESRWLNLELRGNWLEHWQWNAAYTRSDFNMKLQESGGISPARLQQAVLVNPDTMQCFDPTGGCSPANIFGPGRLSANAANFIGHRTLTSREETSQQILSITTNGHFQLGRNWQPSAAAGLEWREDTVRYRPDADLPNVDNFAYTAPSRGQTSVTEAYGELLLPLAADKTWADELELELGLRYSDYSKAGGEWTWKAGLSWTPGNGIRFRGAYQRATRAPNLEENYLAHTEEDVDVLGFFENDPCSASNRPQDDSRIALLCVQQGLSPELLGLYESSDFSVRTEVNGGNGALATENADTYTAGVVWTPASAPGLAVTLDFYRIKIENAIAYINPSQSFNLCFLLVDASEFCKGIERIPTGDISRTEGTYHNLNSVTASGYDLGLVYSWTHHAPWGWSSKFDLAVTASRIEKHEISLQDGVGFDCAGKFGFPCTGVLPRYRLMSRFSYKTGPLLVALSWQWLDSVENARGIATPPGEPFSTAIPKLDSTNYLDLTLLWHFENRASVSIGVLNLTDNSPPLMGGNAIAANTNTDPSTYDVLGRRYRVEVRAWF